MTDNDMRIAFNWAKREGWNPGFHDFQMYHTADPHGFNMLCINGKPISMLASVRYKYSYGFLGMYIVNPEYRGSGYGKLLWDYAMTLMISSKCIGLNAVLNQVSNYEKSGFKFSNFNTRWETTLFNSSLLQIPLNKKHNLSEKIILEEVAELDYRATACYRPEFWQSVIDSRYSYFLGARNNNCLVGFALISRCVNGYKFGPIYAINHGIAENLMTALWGKALQNSNKKNAMLQLDTTSANLYSEQLAKKYGFFRIHETARMNRGQDMGATDAIVHGLASLEIG